MATAKKGASKTGTKNKPVKTPKMGPGPRKTAGKC